MSEQTTSDRWLRVTGMARQHGDRLTDDDLAAAASDPPSGRLSRAVVGAQ